MLIWTFSLHTRVCTTFVQEITKVRSVNPAVESELSVQVHPSPHALWRLFNRETDVLHFLSEPGWKIFGGP